jgi:hypothetical protein
MKTAAAHRKKACGGYPLAAPYDCVISAHPTHSATSTPAPTASPAERTRAQALPLPHCRPHQRLLIRPSSSPGYSWPKNDAAGNHPRTHACFALAVHDAGQMGAGAATPSFATHPLFMLRHSGQLPEKGQQEPGHGQKLLAARDKHGRTTCILSSRDTPTKASRTARVCMSASCGHPIDRIDWWCWTRERGRSC